MDLLPKGVTCTYRLGARSKPAGRNYLRAARRRRRTLSQRMPGGTRYRWVVLAAGTAAQAGNSSIQFGIAVMLPALRREYALSLTEAGVVVAASTAGAMVSLLAWGIAADRLGERIVATVGLATAAAALGLAGVSSSYAALAATLALAGFAGAGVNAASGRAVMHWFEAQERGLAFGIRQAAIPVAGAAAALALPHVVAAGGTRWGLWALGLACLVGSLLALAFLREAESHEEEQDERVRGPLRDRRAWRLVLASAFLVVPQAALMGFAVLFLHDRRGLSTVSAAAVFAAAQALVIGSRIAAGRWSDVVASRLSPLRRIAAASAASVALVGVLADVPLALLLPLVVVATTLSMSWNGLSFAAAAESAGRSRSGAAMGMQQTALAVSGAAVPPLFALVVAGLGWGPAFAVSAVGALAAVGLLQGLRG